MRAALGSTSPSSVLPTAYFLLPTPHAPLPTGAGGIGFDVAEFLGHQPSADVASSIESVESAQAMSSQAMSSQAMSSQAKSGHMPLADVQPSEAEAAVAAVLGGVGEMLPASRPQVRVRDRGRDRDRDRDRALRFGLGLFCFRVGRRARGRQRHFLPHGRRLLTYLLTYLLACLLPYLPTYLPTHLLTCLLTYLQTAAFLSEWGIDGTNQARGGLLSEASQVEASQVKSGQVGGGDDGGDDGRTMYLLQRKGGKHGSGLGKTTGWIHRASLKKLGVQMVGNVTYLKVDDDGLHLKHNKSGKRSVLAVDHVVVCAGQISHAPLEVPLKALGIPTYKIGGAHVATELDAKRAIDQATRLAVAIEDAQPEKVGEYVAPLGAQAWLFQQLVTNRA